MADKSGQERPVDSKAKCAGARSSALVERGFGRQLEIGRIGGDGEDSCALVVATASAEFVVAGSLAAAFVVATASAASAEFVSVTWLTLLSRAFARPNNL
jgi:hypothetical protein